MFKKIALIVVAFFVIAGGSLFLIKGQDSYYASKYSASVTNGLDVGSKINFTLPDQFDKTHTLDANTKVLILSFAKSTGHMVKEFLETQNGSYLTDKNAYFVADIHKMPVVIRNTFAMPDLQKSAYPVVLIYDKAIADKINFVDKADKVAVVTLNDGTIESVKYVSTPKELQASL